MTTRRTVNLRDRQLVDVDGLVASDIPASPPRAVSGGPGAGGFDRRMTVVLAVRGDRAVTLCPAHGERNRVG